VDLSAALAKIRTQLGARCLVSQAGGGLNGALLRAGLVDELHIITVPALIGGLMTLPGTLFTRIRSALDSTATLDPHVLPRGPVA
jgi:riboflavin biosynthesis pyrimidine reductase